MLRLARKKCFQWNTAPTSTRLPAAREVITELVEELLDDDSINIMLVRGAGGRGERCRVRKRRLVELLTHFGKLLNVLRVLLLSLQTDLRTSSNPLAERLNISKLPHFVSRVS